MKIRLNKVDRIEAVHVTATPNSTDGHPHGMVIIARVRQGLHLQVEGSPLIEAEAGEVIVLEKDGGEKVTIPIPDDMKALVYVAASGDFAVDLIEHERGTDHPFRLITVIADSVTIE